MKDYSEILNEMIIYYEKNDYKGFDPYDLKGSKVFYNIQKYLKGFGYHFTDILNLNFPVFLRKLLNIKQKQNAKAFALFLLGTINLYNKTSDKKYLILAKEIYSKTLNLKNMEFKNLCFGYPFNWYNGNEVVANTPNIVVSSFVGMSFMKLYEITKDEKILQNCESIADFILNDLFCYEDKRGICFSYTPVDKKRVHNANLLGAQFLSFLSKYNGKYINIIDEIISFTIDDMNKDYSWNYHDRIEIRKTRIDNYHTAFVLSSLYDINKNMELDYDDIIIRGLDYYTINLFEDGIPVLSDYQKLPIDIHSCASAIICLKKLESLKNNSELIEKIVDFTLKNMYEEGENYFYYRINKLSSIKEKKHLLKRKIFDLLVFKKIDKSRYMRWNDAWMFYALSEIL